VIRADDQTEFVKAFRRIQALLSRPEIRAMREDQNQYVQVEAFIPGREYAIEGVLTAGKLKTLAVFEIVPPGCAGSTVTSTVTVQVAPFAREPIEQLTEFPEVAEQSPPPSWTASTESDAGTVSERATFEAASGPLFVTTRS
jgi:hypothetical protein